MGNLIYQSQTLLEGPWLLNAKHLEALDGIIGGYWGKFEARREKLLRKDIREFKKKYAHIEEKYKVEVNKQIKNHKDVSQWTRSFKSVSIYTKDEPTYTCGSFGEAFRGRYLLNKNPTGFSIDLISGDITFKMFVDISSPELFINIQPEGMHEVQEMYTTVYEWAREIQRQYMGKIVWGKIAKYRKPILTAGTIGFLGFSLWTQYAGVTSTREQLQNLSAQGVTNSNIVDAVNLLINIHTSTKFVVTPLMLVCLLVLAYIWIVLDIHPKVAIGIGKGRDTLLYWKIWQWIIWLPPAFLISDIFKPYLAELVKNFLSLLR